MATKTHSEKYFNLDGTPALFLHGWTPEKDESIVYVTDAENYAVVLGTLGFYVVCVVPNDTFVSDWMHSEFQARKLADEMESR